MIPRSTVPDPGTPADLLEEKPTGPTPPPSIAPADSAYQPEPRRPPDIDPETGRLRPISAAELQARGKELTRRLAEIDALDDTPDEVYELFRRNFDEERRRQGRAPVFEGTY